MRRRCIRPLVVKAIGGHFLDAIGHRSHASENPAKSPPMQNLPTHRQTTQRAPGTGLLTTHSRKSAQNYPHENAKSHNKIAIGFSIAVVTSIVVLLAFAPSQPRQRVTQEQFERITEGMTQAKAESEIGGPPRNELRYPAIIWLPRANGKPISTEIAPVTPAVDFLVREDKPKMRQPGARSASTLDFFPQFTDKNGNQVVWISRSELIAVYFGQDGRLQHKYYSTVHEPVRPSVIDWIAARPRMIRRSLGF